MDKFIPNFNGKDFYSCASHMWSYFRFPTFQSNFINLNAVSIVTFCHHNYFSVINLYLSLYFLYYLTPSNPFCLHCRLFSETNLCFTWTVRLTDKMSDTVSKTIRDRRKCDIDYVKIFSIFQWLLRNIRMGTFRINFTVLKCV